MGDRGLKIYFCGSIQGGRQDAELYTRIIKQLKQYGQVLTEVIGNKDVLRIEAAVTEAEIYEQDIEWLASADVVVAEVTQPSLGVGVELGRAQLLKKKVLCLFRPQEGKSKCGIFQFNSDSSTSFKNNLKSHLFNFVF
eukprot:XP_792098.2 PREDICTED: putative 2'-deoxynucleoside 5'-phosphate N-hydrolase 1 [Strongylocentrotus purpuratus]